MTIAICFNEAPPKLHKGETIDLISEEGAREEAAAVASALRRLGHTAVEIPLGEDISAFVQQIKAVDPVVIFNLCEGYWGHSAMELNVAALLEMVKVPHTGGAPLCLGLTQDKIRTKRLLVESGVPTPSYCAFSPGETPHSIEIPFPAIVKPVREDASLGITSASIVADMHKLRQRVRYVHEVYRQPALVEEFINGREINVAVIGNDPAQVLPFSEICFDRNMGPAIVTYEGKWVESSPEYEGTVPRCPAPLKLGEKKRLKEVALQAYKVCGCRDYARVDIRLRNGVPYVLEVNANPDISPTAGLARSARTAGISYDDLVQRILSMALARKEKGNA